MVKNTISHQFIQNPDVSKFYQQYRVQRKKKNNTHSRNVLWHFGQEKDLLSYTNIMLSILKHNPKLKLGNT